jgi:hypothetical protein
VRIFILNFAYWERDGTQWTGAEGAGQWPTRRRSQSFCARAVSLLSLRGPPLFQAFSADGCSCCCQVQQDTLICANCCDSMSLAPCSTCVDRAAACDGCAVVDHSVAGKLQLSDLERALGIESYYFEGQLRVRGAKHARARARACKTHAITLFRKSGNASAHANPIFSDPFASRIIAPHVSHACSAIEQNPRATPHPARAARTLTRTTTAPSRLRSSS